MFSKSSIVFLLIFSLSIHFSCKEKEQAVQDMNETETSIQKEYNIKKDEKILYSVSMGVMPDLNYEGEGMLIGHVNKERAAARAGILKGDVLVEMDSTKILDLANYTRQLAKYKKGDQVKVVVQRGDQLMQMMVEF